MNITKTDFEGLLIVDPKVFADSRGYFVETYHEDRYQQTGMSMKFVQDNQ
jgi:dTDP-4-dehydrorhamnose 3,5-epimerase